MSATLELTQTLLRQPSITPDDQGCQTLLISRLHPLGFESETFQVNGVTNLWSVKYGKKGGNGQLFVFAGHTDVVPTGDLQQWRFPPFAAHQDQGRLYGRGAADMKTSIAAFVVAVEEFIAQHPDHEHAIGFLITSDEEGPATDGTTYVVQQLIERAQSIDYCLVGEPTSVSNLGDTVKHGRRGSLSGKLTVIGQQGHVAYPHLADNPIHRLAPALAELVAQQWDQGNAHFPPTTWQTSNIKAGTGATNVIPHVVEVAFNFRFSTAVTIEQLKNRVHSILDQHQLNYTLDWSLSGIPFLTPLGTLSEAAKQAIFDETGISPEFSTSGGTSDGRFIAQICSQVIEFGPINQSIHQIDEHIEIATIEPLKNIYRRILEQLVI